MALWNNNWLLCIRFYSEVCTFELDVKIELRFATLKIIYIHFFQSATTDRSKAKFMYILSTLVFISASSSKYPAMQCFFLISIINGKIRKQLRKLYTKKNWKKNKQKRMVQHNKHYVILVCKVCIPASCAG